MRAAALNFILSFLAPCGHERESWPMRLPGEAVAHRTCLECGRRRPYRLFEPENRTVREWPCPALGNTKADAKLKQGIEKGKLVAA